jgi:short-subunit dehydrogenase
MTSFTNSAATQASVKNVVITGASRGLGKAISEIFAQHGYRLFLTARNAVPLYDRMEELLNQYPDLVVKAKPFDLAEKTQAEELGHWVLQEIGRGGNKAPAIDVLVNNAGHFLPGKIYEEGPGSLEKMIQVNLYSAYQLTRVLLPTMMEQRTGHIFNICSIASLQAYPNGGSYSISKFALAGFSKNLREEMKPYGIKVTGVYPGAVFTDSWSASGIDPKRIMEPGDIAQLVYACSQLSPQAVVEDILIRPQLGDI